MAEQSELVEIEKCRAELITPGMSAGEFAELLPPHLHRAYWETKLEQILGEEDASPVVLPVAVERGQG